MNDCINERRKMERRKVAKKINTIPFGAEEEVKYLS